MSASAILHAGQAAWETGRIGGGIPPLRTPEGWLEIYHGNAKPPVGQAGSSVGAYVAGALLLDLENPGRILGQSREPVLVPEADFERDGFVADVVFPTGLVERGDTLQIFYGAADAYTGVCELSRGELMNTIE